MNNIKGIKYNKSSSESSSNAVNFLGLQMSRISAVQVLIFLIVAYVCWFSYHAIISKPDSKVPRAELVVTAHATTSHPQPTPTMQVTCMLINNASNNLNDIKWICPLYFSQFSKDDMQVIMQRISANFYRIFMPRILETARQEPLTLTITWNGGNHFTAYVRNADESFSWQTTVSNQPFAR